MKYTAEEVRAMAKMVGDEFSPHAGLMLTAYAERIKADESAVPAAGTPERQLFDLAHAWGANKIHNYQLMHHIEQIVKKLRTAAQPRAVPDDKARLDLLQNEIVDTIYMDDGRIIDVRGLDVRKAIDEFAAAPSPGESA